MYQHFFRLSQRPFNMTADPEVLFLTPQHREALAGLSYAMLDRKGFLVLTGDAGVGKTTLLTRALEYSAGSRIQSSLILHPTLTPAEFLEMVLLAFGVRDIAASKTQRLSRLHQFLIESDQEGRICVLAVDEAHKLSLELFEEIRLLGNLERSGRKLLQILLLGQNELAELLNRSELRQVKQRVAVRFNLGPLTNTQVEEYIRYRWQRAGGTQIPFTPESLPGIAQYSTGVPRIINAICDNALLLAFSYSSRTVELSHIREACGDLDLALAARCPEELTPPVSEQAAAPIAQSVSSTERSELPSLQRYYKPPANQSLFARWAGKLGLAQ